ncbi:MAG: DUF3372 domain-containing protein, partial [Arsenicicoccus sp.]
LVGRAHLDGHLALDLPELERGVLEKALRGQLVVAQHGPDGLEVLTGLQIPGVLDALYADAAADRQLGASWEDGAPSLALWAPTARSVTLQLHGPADEATAPSDPVRTYPMRRGADGAWTFEGRKHWTGQAYTFAVEVYVPALDQVVTNVVTDPYSVGLTVNSTHSVLVDLDDPRWAPEVWTDTPAPEVAQFADQTIYEMHLRDFSAGDEALPEGIRGSYAAVGHPDSAGSTRLEELAQAGMTTVHLLPTFDIATIEEDRAAQLRPDIPADAGPASPAQQEAVAAVAGEDAYNWGYDPLHYMAPEGSYATEGHQVGGERTREFRAMVGELHGMGLQVVLDQVYNHTAAHGQSERSVLDRIVPGYYQRLDLAGGVENSTCCSNIATEHAMAQKLMVDSTVTWARDYGVDGFRFDLMGHHSRENMLAVREALDELTLESDGVDGKGIYLYGEGWDFGEVAGNARFTQATQGQLGGTSIGTFNDRLRDGVRGGGPFDEDPGAEKGFATGGTSGNDTDLVQVGLAGNLRGFELRSQETGEVVTGEQVDYNGSAAGYAEDPDEVVNYVDAHDNETIFDALTFKLPQDLPMADRVRMNTLALSTTTLSQSISFWHGGADLLRSKSLDRNSYNSGDWFNLLDFTMTENGFGRGLPPAADNEDKWGLMQPLLADPALAPEPADIEQASAMAADLLRLRSSTELFRLGDAELVEDKVSFPVSGTEAGDPQVIVMRIDDTVGADVDPELDGVVVVFNAGEEPVEQAVPGLEGAQLRLSPVQTAGADEVVKGSTWDAASGTAQVPARTVAVFVQP